MTTPNDVKIQPKKNPQTNFMPALGWITLTRAMSLGGTRTT